MKVTSISRKLLSRVLSVYFILTFSVTCIQIVAEYVNTKNSINTELSTLEKTFSSSLTRAVWELNTQQVLDIAEGLVAIPSVQSIIITDQKGQLLAKLYRETYLQSDDAVVIDEMSSNTTLNSIEDTSFGHTFPLIFEFSGRSTQVGTVSLLSSNQIIFNRIEVGIYFLIGNAILKTACLIILFSFAFSKLLTDPLHKLTEKIKELDFSDPEAGKFHHVNYEQNELTILEDAYNSLIDALIDHKEQLAESDREVTDAKDKLDEHNLMLEQEVSRKTASLSRTMLKMETQQSNMMIQQEKLQKENMSRKEAEASLIQSNQDQKELIVKLNKAQDRLLDSEKMSSLGALSAEVTHEVNTPIGISITSASYLSDLLQKLIQEISDQQLTKKNINHFTEKATASVDLLTHNLARASDLISSFKQVAVDQVSDKSRLINIARYVDEIIMSLHPRLKNTDHYIKVNCARDIEIYTYAGAISQILSNLIINSLIHGFEHINSGKIIIDIRLHNKKVVLNYRDNGTGLNSEQKEKIFDAFYTTKSHRGGSGLGTHIVHDLVCNSLNGTVKIESEINEGLMYIIEFENIQKS